MQSIFSRRQVWYLSIWFLIVFLQATFILPKKFELNETVTVTMARSVEGLLEQAKVNDDVGYTLVNLRYSAVENEIPTWKMLANEAFVFERTKLVRAENPRITMFDQIGNTTLIQGDRGEFVMGRNRMQIEGHVVITFPDGFIIETTKGIYDPKSGNISTDQPFYGYSNPKEDADRLQTWGVGFLTSRESPKINILDQAKVEVTSKNERTEIKSDYAVINREQRVVDFTMQHVLPGSDARLVESTQGTLLVRSRRQEVFYNPSEKQASDMFAYEDDFIRETKPKGKKGLKYATAEKAQFMSDKDRIILSGYPSAYQADDTLTGEVIVLHRKINIVEVQQANVLHQQEPASHDK